jgi:RNase P/RNase MRP subunit p29
MKHQSRDAKVALIGETLEVVESKNRTLVGIRGQAIDETRNTITIRTKDGIKRVIKDQVTFKVGNKRIEGKKLSGRIEARIKS